MRDMEESKHEVPASFSRQGLVSIIVYTLSMSLGAAAGFSGVAIPQMKESLEDGGFDLSEEQISWLASLNIFATIPMCVLGGFLGELLGRKTVCCLVSPIFLAGFLCIALAPDIGLLLFGRVLGGIGHGLVSTSAGFLHKTTQVYISEICTPDWRTTFNSGLSAFYMVGMVFTFTLGKWVSWRWLAGLSCTFPLLSLLFLGFIPESPSWLVTQGRLTEARKALQWIRGDRYDVTDEFAKLEASYRKTQKEKNEQNPKQKQLGCQKFSGMVMDSVSKLKRPDVFKPLLLVTTLSLLQQFTGTATTTYYAVVLMGGIKGQYIDKYTATIIYGFIRLLSTFMGGLLLRRFPRRPLLICSSLCVALGMALLGASSYISQGREDVSLIVELLPLIAVNIVAVSYQLGLGPIGWAYIGELYPVDIRNVLSGFSSMLVNIFIFIVIKTFPTLKESSLQPWGTYWLYSSVAVLAAVFGATLLPETKGKTLAEVSDYFYVCCAVRNKHVEDVEYEALNGGVADINGSDSKATDITLSESFVYTHSDKLNSGISESEATGTRRSVELTLRDKNGLLKRRTLEISQEEERTLRQEEKKLEHGSAPIVKQEEMDQLLANN